MLKLKIGDNFLITTEKDKMMPTYIAFTMGCFSLHGKTVLGASPEYVCSCGFDGFIKAIKENHVAELYILTNHTSKGILQDMITIILTNCPEVKISVVKMDRLLRSKEYKLATDVYNALKKDRNSILYHLDKLDEYKRFSNRFKAIPGELKVVNESIKKFSKEDKTCEKKITLQDLEYLNLIDKVALDGDHLILNIKPLPIYPSEPLGRFINYSTFQDNKYIRKVAEYIYKGCHFGMVGTQIAIHPDFKPEFIDSLDHQWDDLFKVNNWSNVGYLHFGRGHLCGGEFNDVIAHTNEHGLDYYFLCLKQYITTANLRDYAGMKVWWYPIYNEAGELVYCAGLDIMRDTLLDSDIDSQSKAEIKDMSIADFQEWRLRHGINFTDLRLHHMSTDIGTHSKNEDMFLKWCQENNEQLYNEIKEGANL